MTGCPPLVALDLDGVVADFNGPAARRLIDLGAEAPSWKTDPPLWGWMHMVATAAQREAFWRSVVARTTAIHDEANRFWWTLPPHRDLSERVLTLLDTLSDQLCLVTARPWTAHDATRDWVNRRLALYRDTPLHLTPGGAKARAYIALGATHVVEDCLTHAIDLQTLAPSIRVYLVDRPYNQSDNEYPNVLRCATTEAALERVARDIEEEK